MDGMTALPMRVFMSNFKKKFRIYAKNVTPKRALNYALVYSSLKMKSPKVWGKPLSLFIEPTNACNLRCPLCPTGSQSTNKKKGLMSFEQYKKIIDDLGPTAFSVTLWNYGEPFINRETINMIKYAKSKGLKVITSTNGYAFKDPKVIDAIIDSGLDEIILAVDGADQEAYSKYRINGDYNEFTAGIKALAEAKKRKKSFFPFMSMQFIIMKSNEHQVEEIKKIAKDLGVNELILKTVYLWNNPILAAKYLPENKEYSRYITDEGITCKTSVRPGCDGLWIGVNINYDGTVVPCCFDTHEQFVFGNAITTKNFEEDIWNSPNFVAFRKNVWEDKGSIDMCKNCPTNTESQDYARIKFDKTVSA